MYGFLYTQEASTGESLGNGSMLILAADTVTGESGSYEATVFLRHGHGHRLLLGGANRTCSDSVDLAISWLAIHFNKLHQYIMGTPGNRSMLRHQDTVVQMWHSNAVGSGPSGGLTVALATMVAAMGCRLDRTCGVTGGVLMNGNLIASGETEAKARVAKSLGLTKLIIPYSTYVEMDLNDIDEEEIREYCRRALVPVGTMVDVLAHLVSGKGQGSKGLMRMIIVREWRGRYVESSTTLYG